jgi:tetrahydromethanopterin S-methyltransferase subunit C
VSGGGRGPRPGMEPDAIVTAGILIGIVGIIAGALLGALPVMIGTALVSVVLVAAGASSRPRLR